MAQHNVLLCVLIILFSSCPSISSLSSSSFSQDPVHFPRAGCVWVILVITLVPKASAMRVSVEKILVTLLPGSPLSPVHCFLLITCGFYHKPAFYRDTCLSFLRIFHLLMCILHMNLRLPAGILSPGLCGSHGPAAVSWSTPGSSKALPMLSLLKGPDFAIR